MEPNDLGLQITDSSYFLFELRSVISRGFQSFDEFALFDSQVTIFLLKVLNALIEQGNLSTDALVVGYLVAELLYQLSHPRDVLFQLAAFYLEGFTSSVLLLKLCQSRLKLFRLIFETVYRILESLAVIH